MPALTLQAFIDLVLPELHAITFERMRNYQANPEFSWIPRVFNVQDTNRFLHEYGDIERTRDWPEVQELDDIPVTQWDLPTQSDVQMSIHQDSFQVSRHWLTYANPFQVIIPKLSDFANDFLLGGYRAHNRKAGAIMLDIFTGALLTTPDGQPLASNNHSHSGTSGYDNYLTGKLTDPNLKVAFELNSAVGLVDRHGNPLVHNFDTLLVGSGMKIAAWELIANMVKPGANNDQRNYWPTQIQYIEEVPWWREVFKSGASQYWGLIDSTNNPFQGLVAAAPHFLPETNANVNARQIVGETLMQYFFLDWEGGIFSDGTTA